jgi:flagellar biosynthesis/type III secretory pathway protein FliH
MMKTSPFRSEFVESFVDEGIRQGIRQGIEQGIEQGKARGEAAALLKLLKARGIDLTEEQHDAVTSSTDLEEIDRWFDRALTATSANGVFGD